jgi:hypothetical protein
VTTLKLRGDIGKLLWSQSSPSAGDPTCLCSACGKWISEDCLPIRLTDMRKNLEARFCDECAYTWMGIKTFPDEPGPGDPF